MAYTCRLSGDFLSEKRCFGDTDRLFFAVLIQI